MKSFILITAILILASCSKITPNKLEGDWELKGGFYKWAFPGYELNTEWIQEGNLRYRQNDTIQYDQHTYSFNKDGTFEIKYEADLHDTTNVHYIDIYSGTWSIMGKSKHADIKTDSRIVFHYSEVIRLHKELSSGQIDTVENYIYNLDGIWHVEKLNNRELILKIDHQRVLTIAPQDSYYRTIRMEFEKH